MFYRLRTNCKLVEGSARGAIYDLSSGKVHSINQGAVSFLKACENSPVETILNSTDYETYYQEFIDRLTGLNLGALYYHPPTETSIDCLQEVAPAALEFAWLEITPRCNNTCLHCYASSGPSETFEKVPHDRWLSLIAEIAEAGAKDIQLIGGEPLMYPRWKELVIKANEHGFSLIEIFTNGTLIDDSCIQFFKQHNVSVATTLYAGNAEIHDLITKNPGSFSKTIAAVKKVVAAGIPIRIASILMKPNEHEAENIMKLCSELGVVAGPPDVIRPTGRGKSNELAPEHYRKPPIKPPFFTDPLSFARAHHFNSCLAGKIAITSDGDVIPCIFARNKVCGNVLQESLKNILGQQPLQQSWHTTKDCLEKCKDCEYRYACTDCRPLAQSTDPDSNWLACSAGCSYNPYIGKWEDEK